jgi:UrcA family protein
MKDSKLCKSLLTIAVIVALGVPTIASAGDRSDLKGVSVKVSYADLNAETKKDALLLYRRLKQASKQVCDYRCFSIAGSAKRMLEVDQCYREALSAAVRQVDNELVTNIHKS